MGSRYLTDLDDVLRRAGLTVHEESGWQNRARGSGGYDSGRPNHIMVHHTASGPSSDGQPDVNYCTYGDEDAPLCNLYINRSGEWWVCAAGATNTNGSGHDPCGKTSDDSMNSSAIGIEAGNGGTGEQWPAAQLDSYEKGCKALSEAYDIPISCIHAHWEWAPTRKSDPAGGPRYQSGSPGPQDISWNMDEFRNAVSGESSGGGDTPPPKPKPPKEDWMADLPTIKKGSTGPYVERMQHLLAAAGYMDPANTANYDGVWGNGTDGAKQKFDKDHGLTPSPPTDCGDKSWQSLMTGKKW